MNPAAPTPVCPYPGLRPFEASDEKFFFGREAQIDAILQRLENHQFVAVVGSSGSGKSSLIRAGVLPAVMQGFLLGTKNWRTLTMIPGSSSAQVLAAGLRDEILRSDTPVEKIQEQLESSETGLLDVLSGSVPTGTNIMIVVDQFEEIFGFRRLDPKLPEAMKWRDHAAAFVRMLLRSAKTSSHVWVILTMRSDFIGDCEAFLGLPEAVSESQFLVPRLNRSQMESAVYRPSEVATPPFTVEPTLVNRVVNDAGDRPDQLPLLQHALMRTWQLAQLRGEKNAGPIKLFLKDYVDVGKMEEALAKHVESAWEELKNPRLEFIAKRLFLLLCDVAPDDQKISRRRPRVSEVLEVTGATLAEIDAMVSLFQKGDRNFLKFEPAGQPLTENSRLDIPHEALFRQWPRWKTEWLPKERVAIEDLKILARLGNADANFFRGRDLRRFSEWKGEFGKNQPMLQAWARRYLGKDVEPALKFLAASERSNWIRKAGFATLALAVCILLVSRVSNSVEEKKQALAAETREQEMKLAQQREERVNLYLRAIGFSSDSGATPEETTALWQLAETPVTNELERRTTLGRWFQTEESVIKPLSHGGRGLRAAVGLNPAIRDQVTQDTTKLVDRLMEVLSMEIANSERDRTGPPKTENQAPVDPSPTPSFLDRIPSRRNLDPAESIGSERTRLGQVVGAVEALGELLPPEKTNQTALVLTSALVRLKMPVRAESGAAPVQQRVRTSNAQSPLRSPEPEEYIQDAWTFSDAVFRPLSSAIISLSKRLQPSEIAAVAAKLQGGLRDSNTGSGPTPGIEADLQSERQTYLARTLSELAPRLDPSAARSISQDLAELLEKNGSRALSLQQTFCPVLSAFAARLAPSDAHAVVWPTAKRLVQEMTPGQSSEPRPSIVSLAQCLDPLLPHVNASDRAAFISTAVKSLLVVISSRTSTPVPANPLRRPGLSRVTNARELTAIGNLIDKTPPSAAGEIYRMVLGAWDELAAHQVTRTRIQTLVDRAAARLSPEETAALAREIVSQMEAGPLDAESAASRKGPSLNSFITRLSPSEGEAIATRLLRRAEAPSQVGNAAFSRDFAQTIAATAPLMAPPNTAAALRILLRQLENPAETDAEILKLLETGVLALNLNAGEFNSVAQTVGTRLVTSEETDTDRLQTFHRILANLIPKLNPGDVLALARKISPTLINPEELDMDRLPAMAGVLATAMNRLTPAERQTFVDETSHALTAALDKAEQNLRVPALAQALAAELQGQNAPDLNRRVIEISSAILVKLQPRLVFPDSEDHPNFQSEFGSALGHLAKITPAPQLKLFAINQLISGLIFENESDPTEDMSLLNTLADQLSVPELAELLKSPFCVGTTQTLVLAKLEKKTGRQFQQDLWKFVGEAPTFGIKDISSPAQRPSSEKVRIQLMLLQTGSGEPATAP